jgi:hypothetical protein
MFYTDLQSFWRELYNPDAIGTSDSELIKDYNVYTGFHNNVTENPALLNFWIDFMDTNSEMG